MSTILRAIAVGSLLLVTVSNWRSGKLSRREKRAVLVLTLVMVGLAAGALLWAASLE
ncbi:MAG TPA: hypothetical protein VFS08_03635 [Gemmatimonadaceae bacterium]|nr:hypothetical protein [Gemmatimonadaceae bacterium]